MKRSEMPYPNVSCIYLGEYDALNKAWKDG